MKINKVILLLGIILSFATYSFVEAVDSTVEVTAKSPLEKATTQYQMLAPLGNLVGQNGVIDIANGGLSKYLNTLFRAGIILATGLAIIMITIGGLKYASTDAINGKSEGKEMIQQALLGLVLALMSVILLQQINPALLRSDIGLKPISTQGKQINTVNVQLNGDGGGTTSRDGGVTTENPTNETGNNSGPITRPNTGNQSSSNNPVEPPLPTEVSGDVNTPNPLLPPITQ